VLKISPFITQQCYAKHKAKFSFEWKNFKQLLCARDEGMDVSEVSENQSEIRAKNKIHDKKSFNSFKVKSFSIHPKLKEKGGENWNVLSLACL
jgi:hypothetical protein